MESSVLSPPLGQTRASKVRRRSVLSERTRGGLCKCPSLLNFFFLLCYRAMTIHSDKLSRFNFDTIKVPRVPVQLTLSLSLSLSHSLTLSHSLSLSLSHPLSLSLSLSPGCIIAQIESNTQDDNAWAVNGWADILITLTSMCFVFIISLMITQVNKRGVSQWVHTLLHDHYGTVSECMVSVAVACMCEREKKKNTEWMAGRDTHGLSTNGCGTIARCIAISKHTIPHAQGSPGVNFPSSQDRGRKEIEEEGIRRGWGQKKYIILAHSVHVDQVSIWHLDSFRAFAVWRSHSLSLSVCHPGVGGGGDIFTKFLLMTSIYINTRSLSSSLFVLRFTAQVMIHPNWFT